MASVEDATRTMIENLQVKTGKSLDQWVRIVKSSGQEKHGQIVAFLKKEHGIGHGYANLVAHTTLAGAGESDDLVAAQYAGARAALRPIYDAIVAKISEFGHDLELAPKKANVSVRRSKQFALIQPSTAARLDIGIKLKGVAAKGRLETSGSFSEMVTHRVRIEKAGDVDAELIGWLKQAYDAA